MKRIHDRGSNGPMVRPYLTSVRTKVSTKGQIVLPAEIRRKDRIKAGQQFEVERIRNGEYGLVRVSEATGVGSWTGSSLAQQKATSSRLNRNQPTNCGIPRRCERKGRCQNCGSFFVERVVPSPISDVRFELLLGVEQSGHLLRRKRGAAAAGLDRGGRSSKTSKTS